MPVHQAPGVLQVRDLAKSYAIPVLRGVRLDVAQGEVHALIGANGAGKTTLSKIISGMVRPDEGRMLLGEMPYAPRDKSDAEARGVHIVQQELNLISTLSVAENLFLNRFPHRFGVLSRRVLREQAIHDLALVGLEHVAPDTPLSSLGIGQQQLVVIAAALSRRCRLLILDEPTAALTDPQIDLLFEHIRRLRSTGVGIIYISHRMDELRRIADRATILRDGKVVGSDAMPQLATEQIVRLLAGRELEQSSHHRARSRGPVLLRVKGMTRSGTVKGVSLDVAAGEIFGLAGLVGSGRTELLRTVFGADRADSGSVELGDTGTPNRFRSPRQAVRAGIAMIPEDRRQHGLLMSQSITTNVTLGSLPRFASRFGRVHVRRERQAVCTYCDLMQVQRQTIEQRLDQLSGGNQQKVVIARWLLRDATVFLFDEPTRGIDVAAKATVYRLLNELADRGKAVVVVSSELRELLDICDRIGVMSGGRLVAVFRRGEWSQESIMHAALSGRVT